MKDNCHINRWETLKKQLQNLTPESFLMMKKQHPDAVVLDCRVPGELATGYIEGAVNLDYFGAQFYEELENLDTEATYLVYCRSGRRSLRTCTLMKNSGFRHIYNLEGGLKLWQETLGKKGLVFP